MCKLTLIAGLCLVIASLASSLRLVCNYDKAAKARLGAGTFLVTDINPSYCTHLIYGDSEINSQHRLISTDDQDYRSINALKVSNLQLKTLLTVGGLQFGTQKFVAMVSTQQNRATFIQSAIALLRQFGFDGLNLDWRFPGTSNKQSFTLLCKELKAAFVAEATLNRRATLILTASVSAEKATIDGSYEVAKIVLYLDFLNVLTFDFRKTSDNVVGHHSPLYRGSRDTGNHVYSNTDFAMQYWHTQGAPKQKLNMGLAAYGRVFTLSSAASTGVGAAAIGPGEEGDYTLEDGLWSYYETCLNLNGITPQLITDQQVPYAVKSDDWVGFDNQASINRKVTYLKANLFGGAFVWSLDLDDFSGSYCKQGKFPFIRNLHMQLISGTANPCTGMADGLYPHPTQPSSFYSCAHQIAHLQHCNSNTVFKYYCKCCDFPTNNNPSIPTHPFGTFCSGKPNGLYYNPNNLRTFYSCCGQLTYLMSCPGNLVFNQYSSACDYPSTSSHIVGNPCSGRSNGLYVNAADPTTYFSCVHNRAYTLNCPPNTIFKAYCNCCDHPSNMNPTLPGQPSGTFCVGKPNGLHANPPATSTYYSCFNDITYLQKCPAHLVFQSYCSCCQFPAYHLQGTFCYQRLDGLYPHPQYPNKFYNCCHGITNIQLCPNNLVFNQLCNCCDWP